jgi:AcrR family transcriptional regulator
VTTTEATAATTSRPLRADALRNRGRVLEAARTLFAASGSEVQMEDIAAHAGVGVGTIYRHFPTKTALLTEMVRDRFAEMTAISLEVETSMPGAEALLTALRRSSEAVSRDQGFQLGVMGWEDLDWDVIQPEVDVLGAVTQRLIDRAVAGDHIRADLTFDDIGLLMCGVTATMHFKPGEQWRRCLDLVLDGLRP